MYQFDNILKPNVTQENVYNTAAKDIVKGKNFSWKDTHAILQLAYNLGDVLKEIDECL